MAIQYEDDVAPRRGRIQYEDAGQQPPAQDLPPVDRIGEITRRGAKETGFVPEPGAKPAEQPGLGTQVLQSLAAVPVLGAGARGLQLATKGLPKVAPYTQRFAELMLPKTGAELARTTAGVGTGTALAYGAGELLPPGASPVIREAVQFGAGALGELPFAVGQQVGRALRPYTERGVERAGERVVRAFQPERIETLPEFKTGKTEIRRSLQERLRGEPLFSPQTAAQDISTLLGTDVASQMGTAERLAQQMAGRAAARGERIGTVRTESAIGDDIRKPLEDRLNSLVQARRLNAQQTQQQAFGDAFQKESAGQNVVNTDAARRATQQINIMIKNPVTGLAGVPKGDVKNQLTSVKKLFTGKEELPDGTVVDAFPSFEALEIERRLLRDRASGLPVEGYKAISTLQAGQLADMIEQVQREFSPSFGRFLEQYRRDSEPINQFKTALGKAITGKEEFDFSQFRVDPAGLADKVFGTRDSARNFVALTGNNVNLANDLARDFLASKLQGAKTADQISQELRKYEWLTLPEFAPVRRDFAEQARITGRVAKRGEEITGEVAKRTEPLQLETKTRTAAEGFRGLLTGPSNVQNVKEATQILMRQPEGPTVFKQAVRDTLATEPPGQLRMTFSNRIRPALEASGMYRPDELDELSKIVTDLDAVNLAVTRAMSRVESMPGTLSPERELTQLIQDEVYQTKIGTAVGGTLAGLIASALTNFGAVVGGGVGGAGALALAPFMRSYKEYNANIRKAVSDIISDPARLKQVLEAPAQQRPSILAGMLRTGIYSAGVATNEPQERRNAVNER